MSTPKKTSTKPRKSQPSRRSENAGYAVQFRAGRELYEALMQEHAKRVTSTPGNPPTLADLVREILGRALL